MNFLIKTCMALIVPLLSIALTSAGELEDIMALKKTANKQLITLKSTGIGHMHPEIIAKEKEIEKLQNQIDDLRASSQEIVILIKGASSIYLEGHQKYGKSKTALPELLLSGWEIRNIISAGDEKAYVWLTRE